MNSSKLHRFDWNWSKNAANKRKHGVSFEEAIGVFEDPFQINIRDRVEAGELRWRTIGRTGKNMRLLVVAHTWEDHSEMREEVFRIVSARQATRSERNRYEHGE